MTHRGKRAAGPACPSRGSGWCVRTTDRASRVAPILLFHACCRHYPGGIGRCLRRSLPNRWQPSPENGRVGSHVASFEACSAFTHVAARMVAEPPNGGPFHRSASGYVVTSITRSDCYRLERQLPGGICTRCRMVPFTAHRSHCATGMWSGSDRYRMLHTTNTSRNSDGDPAIANGVEGVARRYFWIESSELNNSIEPIWVLPPLSRRSDAVRRMATQ